MSALVPTVEQHKPVGEYISVIDSEAEPTLERSQAAEEAVEEEGIAAKSALAKQKTKRNVRFLITEGGDVVPESVKFDHISNSSNARCKANEAMEGLLAGNQRFRKGILERCRAGPEILAEVAGDVPKPSTVILSCSDSRVPPELICDQGLGDCHVVRVAGNVVNDFVMGSILFAVQHLGCRLVLVLAHSRCSVVASAVQTWARNKSLTRDGQSVRTLAEGVQQTLSHGPASDQLHRQVSEDPKVSPFHPESSSYPQEDKQSKPSFFAKLCGGCGGEEVEDDYRGGHAAAHPSSKNQGEGISEGRRGGSNDRSVSRHGMVRQSVNPLTLLVGAIGSVVESVAASGEHDSFKSLVHKEAKGRGDNGWEDDDEDLKRGLVKQDSLEFTRARLAKKKADRKIEHLRELAGRADVDSVIDENSKVSAQTILKSLVKNLDVDIAHEMEVVAGKYLIQDGTLKVLSRSWYSNKTYFCSLEHQSQPQE